MSNPLVAKLEQFAKLSAADRRVLDSLATHRVRRHEPRAEIVREGEAPQHLYLILTGWACRYKQLEDGRRQILNFLLPGDLCDLNIFILRQMDHSIAAITPVTVSELSSDSVEKMTSDHGRITQALWWDSLVSVAIQREWTVNVGQRSAFERMAHLFCELFVRLAAVGLAKGQSCDFPLTQTDLAQATGLSAVHVNRTLQELRAAGLIVLRDKTLVIADLEALKNIAMFNPNYLHLDREGRHLDANVP
jgi:CRP-like cAMP-binding protein